MYRTTPTVSARPIRVHFTDQWRMVPAMKPLASIAATLAATMILPLAADPVSDRSRELQSAPPESLGLSPTKLQSVDAKVAELLAAKRLAGAAVVITRKGKVVYDKRFGFADLAKEEPIKPDTIFRIYSMTKAITSAAALILVEEEKIALDDPIAKHFPAFAKVTVWKDGEAVAPQRPPTVRDLLCHTAGYSYGASGIPEVDERQRAADPFAADNTLAEFATRMATVPLAFEPGTSWMYGVSSDLLGAVVQAASGMPFEDFLQKRIFDPLAMVDTGFTLPEEKLARLATVYTSNQQGELSVNAHDDSRYAGKVTLPSGGGGLLSTIRDYTRFLQMIANGGELHGTRLLREDTVAQMTRNQLKGSAMPIRFPNNLRRGTGFGLGFSVKVADTPWNAKGRIGEYGWGGFLSTHYWVSPDDELVVVTMEQTFPYDFLLEDALKPLIYEAIGD